VYICAYGGKNLEWIDPQFLVLGILDVITCFKFGDDCLRDLASADWADGQILPSTIDFDGRPSITNCSFRYASHYLWNQLPSLFRQPHSVHSPPGSSRPARITSSQSPSSLSPSVTPSTFHSRLKAHLFHNPFLHILLIPFGLLSRILNLYWTKWALAFFVLVSCARLSWSQSDFESMLNLYRIVSRLY